MSYAVPVTGSKEFRVAELPLALKRVTSTACAAPAAPIEIAPITVKSPKRWIVLKRVSFGPQKNKHALRVLQARTPRALNEARRDPLTRRRTAQASLSISLPLCAMRARDPWSRPPAAA